MVSVIIPSYNSEHTIIPVLQALHQQTYLGEYEIILVDSSEDRTPELVTEHFPGIIYFHFNRKTDPGTARNKGLELSSGDPVLFIDSDCRAHPQWIENMVKAHKNSIALAVGGAVENGNDPSIAVAWAGYIAEFREFIPQQPASEVGHIPTCNISYKRVAFEDDLFNPDYYPQEDLEFNYRLRRKGGIIRFEPQIIVYHQHREQVCAFFNHQRRIGQITSRMLKILPLQGASIARSKIRTILLIPTLMFVKLVKTLWVFRKLDPGFIFTHKKSFLIFALGLFPWARGFIAGSFTKP